MTRCTCAVSAQFMTRGGGAVSRVLVVRLRSISLSCLQRAKSPSEEEAANLSTAQSVRAAQ